MILLINPPLSPLRWRGSSGIHFLNPSDRRIKQMITKELTKKLQNSPPGRELRGGSIVKFKYEALD
jgi:hypothetical protein